MKYYSDIIHFLYRTAKIMSWPLFVCMPAKLRKKWMNRFSWNFQDRSRITQGSICKILVIVLLTSSTCFLVWDQFLSLRKITKKGMERFSWNFQDMSGIAQVIMWWVWGISHHVISPWIQDIFFFGTNPCLLATLRKKNRRVYVYEIHTSLWFHFRPSHR